MPHYRAEQRWRPARSSANPVRSSGDFTVCGDRLAIERIRPLAKLAEVFFFEVLHLYMHEQGEGRTGWLADVGDRIVGAALNALHKKPCHAWTLDELARAAGTSRSMLAERFQ